MAFFAELKRRNVVRVAVAYVVAAWLLLQFADVMIGLMELPAVVGKAVVLFLLLGFLPALIFAWVWELTPEGLKRERDIDRAQTITTNTGRKLNAVIVVMLTVAAGYFFWESRFKQEPLPAGPTVATTRPPASEPATPAQTANDKSVAVLPFVNMSADPDNEFFADGLSEEILNRLAQVSALRVIGRSSSFSFKGQNRDLREIGEILGSATVLEGSVRRQGKLVRVTAQLVASADGAHLWSQTYDRLLDDVFAIQDEIAQNVVDALDIVLDETTRRAMLDAGVRNVDAFVAYQKGYQMMIDAHSAETMMSDLYEANTYFDAAIKAAPDFAEAYAEKTDYYAHVVLDEDFTRTIEEREAALQTMLALLNVAYEKARDPRRRLTIDIDRTFFSDDWSRLPGLVEALLASDGCADGNWMELVAPFVEDAASLKYYQQQIACDPLMLLSYSFVSGLQFRMGDPDAAQATIDAGRRARGEHRWLAGRQAIMDMQTGKAGVMLEALDARTATTDATGPELRFKVTLLALLGRAAEARTLFDELRDAGHLDVGQTLVLAARLGDRELANATAARLDEQPGGSVELIRVSNNCSCGKPFDLEYTPLFANRLASAGWQWNPPTSLTFPAKGW